MKKLSKVTLFTAMLVLGLGYVVSAEVCITARIHCSDGTGTNTSTCGETLKEAKAEAEEVAEAFCGPN